MIWRVLATIVVVLASYLIKEAWDLFPAIGFATGAGYLIGSWGRRDVD